MSDELDIPAFQTVDERWNWLLENLPAIGKDSRNEQQGFNYRSIDTVLDHLNPLLAGAGLHIIPTQQTFERGSYTTGRGTLMQTCTVTSSWQIRDVTGAVIEAQTVGEGADSGDKATSKAQTAAFKYLLWPGLAISSNEDPDGITIEEAVAPQAQQPRQQEQSRGSGGNVQPTQGQPPAQNRQQRSNSDGPPEPSPNCNIRLGGKNPITDGQKRAFWAMSGGGEKFSLSAFIGMHTNGKTEDSLTSWEASQLIDGVNSGRLETQVSTAGAEAIADAFPGAEVVKSADSAEGYGFSDEAF